MALCTGGRCYLSGPPAQAARDVDAIRPAANAAKPAAAALAQPGFLIETYLEPQFGVLKTGDDKSSMSRFSTVQTIHSMETIKAGKRRLIPSLVISVKTGWLTSDVTGLEICTLYQVNLDAIPSLAIMLQHFMIPIYPNLIDSGSLGQNSRIKVDKHLHIYPSLPSDPQKQWFLVARPFLSPNGLKFLGGLFSAEGSLEGSSDTQQPIHGVNGSMLKAVIEACKERKSSWATVPKTERKAAFQELKDSIRGNTVSQSGLLKTSQQSPVARKAVPENAYLLDDEEDDSETTLNRKASTISNASRFSMVSTRDDGVFKVRARNASPPNQATTGHVKWASLMTREALDDGMAV